ncbi:MAG: GIY-YIG nuclease family protein [bacterium]|nr:GIY-YIG nuclease family protein [bacterium]
MYYVYILRSLKDEKDYVGLTNNLPRRLAEHNRGSHATPSTLGRGPFKLVYSEEVNTMKKGREREKFFKSGVGRAWRRSNIPR